MNMAVKAAQTWHRKTTTFPFKSLAKSAEVFRSTRRKGATIYLFPDESLILTTGKGRAFALHHWGAR